ncbi:MAG: ATP-binding domain-containing protein, partial [Clostridia bacterium]|nr:ATP-binding domain-containing protein [Clostridia bacterium]
QEQSAGRLPSEITALALSESGYRDMLTAEDSVENQTRLENLEEFLKAATEYEGSAEEPSLAGFLELTALVSDVDNYDQNADSVVLMTLHSAKGLEFPHVFLCGMEEGLFPGQKSQTEEEIEEERRLCYVGITRAKQVLTLSYAGHRNYYGSSGYTMPSRFLGEIPMECLNTLVKETEKILIEPQKKKSYSFTDNAQLISALSADREKKKAVSASYKPGDVVEHRKFGRGMILSVTPAGDDFQLEIAFDEHGTKNLMGSFAKLKKLSDRQ